MILGNWWRWRGWRWWAGWWWWWGWRLRLKLNRLGIRTSKIAYLYSQWWDGNAMGFLSVRNLDVLDSYKLHILIVRLAIRVWFQNFYDISPLKLYTDLFDSNLVGTCWILNWLDGNFSHLLLFYLKDLLVYSLMNWSNLDWFLFSLNCGSSSDLFLRFYHISILFLVKKIL